MMQIVQVVNVTRGAVLAEQAQLAVSLFQRLKGLLGRQELKSPAGLILQPCSSIHTFFMHFTIDVLFLDKNKRIVKIIEKMPPHRLTPPIWRSSLAIELPAGKVAQTHTQVGDQLKF